MRPKTAKRALLLDSVKPKHDSKCCPVTSSHINLCYIRALLTACYASNTDVVDKIWLPNCENQFSTASFVQGGSVLLEQKTDKHKLLEEIHCLKLSLKATTVFSLFRLVEEKELLVFPLQIFHVKWGEMAVNQRSEELSVEECEAEPRGWFLTEISSDSLWFTSRGAHKTTQFTRTVARSAVSYCLGLSPAQISGLLSSICGRWNVMTTSLVKGIGVFDGTCSHLCLCSDLKFHFHNDPQDFRGSMMVSVWPVTV